MKKTIAIAVIVWCVFLWLWFFFGRSSNVSNDVLWTDNFERQKYCLTLYDHYKDKTELLWWPIDDLVVFYSPKEDSCLASWILWIDTDGNIISDFYQYNIVNALKWDEIIFQCAVDIFKQNNECWLTMFRRLKYNLAN